MSASSVLQNNVPQGTSPCYTLSEGVDEYLVTRGVDRKKYYTKYLIIAQRVWQDIFWNTLWVTKSVWQPIKRDAHCHYIDVPRDSTRLFTIARTDHCGNIIPLYYNSGLNVIRHPHKKACGCTGCDCGGLCTDVNGFTMTTKLLFTVNGVDYYEKTWLQYCPNGDILEYQEIPTKKYNDFTGDGGDFNSDYDEDFLIGDPPFANYSIVTEKFQRKICHLSILPCGCPEESPENLDLIVQSCACFLPLTATCRTKRCCQEFLANPSPNSIYGQVKLSECGTKIYFRATRDFSHGVNTVTFPIIPDFLLVNYQSNGKNPDGQTQVPDYALMALWTGIDWRSKIFNSKYSLGEKQQAKYEHNDAVNKVIQFLNPLNLETLSYVQDAPIRW